MTTMDTVSEWESAIYKGYVRHRRFSPMAHEFRYPLFMMLLKIDEIPDLCGQLRLLGDSRWHWARLRRQDYLGLPELTLDEAIRYRIAEKLGEEPSCIYGDLYFLGQLRYLGIYFSPLNLYFLKREGKFRYMLAEVSNTPWNERHYYLIDLQNNQRHSKQFHVSPFNPMSQVYRWRIVPPEKGKTLASLHIDSYQCSAGDADLKVFDATLKLERLSLNQKQLNNVLIKTPAQTLSIVAGIYWQALKLFIKGAPYHAHPGNKQEPAERIKYE